LTTALWRIATPVEAGAIHPISSVRAADIERVEMLLNGSEVRFDEAALGVGIFGQGPVWPVSCKACDAASANSFTPHAR
jgi:hypothetical protein